MSTTAAIRTLCIFICTLCLPAFTANVLASSEVDRAARDFNKGIQAYNASDYENALVHFNNTEAQAEGFAIYFNLGNTYFKLNRIPESILHFERALKFEPANEDARYNLGLANERIADRIERLPKTKFSLWWDDTRYGMGPDGWAWIAVGLSAAAACLLFLFAFGKNQGSRRFGFFAGLLSFGLMIAAYSLSQSAADFRYGNTSAVIFTDKVDVKSEPRVESSNVFVLHAGTRVDLLRSEGEWQHVEIASGGKGWIRTEDLREI